MHNFSTYIAAASLLVALLAVVYAFSARHYAHYCYEYVEGSNKRSRTLKQLTLIETELTEQADSIKAIQSSLHKLRSRIHARNVNDKKAAATGVDDIHDDYAWKRRMNAQDAQPRSKES